MFYEFGETIEEKKASELTEGRIAVGYISVDELDDVAPLLGIDDHIVSECQYESDTFRSAIEIYRKFTFTKLKIFDPSSDQPDDCLAFFIAKDMMLLVDIFDADQSTFKMFKKTVDRFAPETMSIEKFLYAFVNELIVGDLSYIESLGTKISDMEESLEDMKSDAEFNKAMLKIKKKLQRMHNMYEQYIDITEVLETNENEILASDALMHIENLDKRVSRLRDDVDSLASDVDHLQDAYLAQLDVRMNKTMKLLTVLSTIFFPLTIIVGWYGMNFKSMPEFNWQYGYLYVICLSLGISGLVIWIARKNKWL